MANPGPDAGRPSEPEGGFRRRRQWPLRDRRSTARSRHRRFDSLVAAIAVLETDQRGASDATTLVEATPSGWWYAALLPGERLVVTNFSDPDLLRRSAPWQPAHWWNHLRTSRLIWEFVASHGYTMPAHVRIRPAASTLLPRPCGENGSLPVTPRPPSTLFPSTASPCPGKRPSRR